MARKSVQLQDFIANLPLFRQLAPGEVERIAAGSLEVDAPRGTVLFHRGDPCSGFHIVIFGQVKLALQVTLPAKKGVIASRLNLTHEHFSRILHELIEARLVAVDGLQVTIPDIARLRSYGA